jgi:hypothetical protein
MPEARSRFQSWLAILAGERSHLCNLHEIGRLSGCGRLTLSAKLALWFVTLVITILCHKPPAGCYQVSVSLGECWPPPLPEVIPDITKIFNKILGGAPYTHSPYRWCGRWAEAHPHQLPNAKYIDSCKRTPKGVVRTNLVDASTSMPRSPWTMGGSCTSLARSRSKEILAGNFGWGKIGPLQFAGAGLID